MHVCRIPKEQREGGLSNVFLTSKFSVYFFSEITGQYKDMLKIVGICLLEASFTATEEYWKTRGGRNTRVHVFTIAHLYVCRCRSYKRKQEGCVKKFGGNQVKKIFVAMQTSCREFVHAKRKGKGFSK